MNKLMAYFKDSYNEMTEHVTWASYAELQESSILVLVASVIFALMIGVMDISFSKLLEVVYTIQL